MSSKRRNAKDLNGSTAKKIKNEESNSKDDEKASAVVCGGKAVAKCATKEWEFRAGKNKWKPYDPCQNKTISQAFSSGAQTTDITTAKATFSVVFDRMVQRNVKTGFEVPVKCKHIGSPADEKYVWQWQDAQKSWKTYSDGINRLLDAAVAHELKTVSFNEDKIDYTVNMVKKEQVNKSTKAKGSVRHVTEEIADKEAQTQATSSVSKSRGKKGDSSKSKTVPKETKESIKSIVFKGKSPVDDICPIKDKVQVFCEGDVVWDAMLNQTNVKNNNNKYYLMQLLQDAMTNRYHVWFRWGRVGFNGQNSLTSFGGDLEGAKMEFGKKFSDKTKNRWEEKDDFEKVPGKYDLIIVEYNPEKKDETDAPPPKKQEKIESKLDKRLQVLIEFICNVKNMEDAVKEMKYDTNKAPLGKLTKDQIKAGFQALKVIDQCISKRNFGTKLVEACNAFYTRIPHCFGMRQPPIIRTKEDVKLKIELLETLGDIEIAMKILNEELDENRIDSHYKALKCDLLTLDKTHEDFEMIQKYTQNTHAKTHSHYSIIVEDVFVIDDPKSPNFVDHGNKMLLWHGSRLTNWVGILNRGLRIAPPEAPVTGYMFGKGVYFADMSSKSANYCYATRRQNTGILMLSEVSLGKTNDLLAADCNAAELPPDCHSVVGLGKIVPDPNDNYTMSNGTVVPLGKGIESGVHNPNGYTLNYNEYIVYDTNQIKMKYLVRVKFDFK